MTHEYITRKIETDGLVDKRKGNQCCVVPIFMNVLEAGPMIWLVVVFFGNFMLAAFFY